MYIISYDVASKSMAMSIIYFNDNWKQDLAKIKCDFNREIILCKVALEVCICVLKYIDQLDDFINTLIIPKIFDVVDLIPGKKLKDTTPILRASRLGAYLQYIESIIPSSVVGCKYKVLLEYQMGPNDKSRSICSQIMYHYAPMDKGFKNTYIGEKSNLDFQKQPNVYDVEIIGPSLKNKINLIKDKPYSYFMQKYTKSYDANKAHSKSNFLHWIKTNKKENMIKNIKKNNLDDIADSVNMTLAWIYLKSGLI